MTYHEITHLAVGFLIVVWWISSKLTAWKLRDQIALLEYENNRLWQMIQSHKCHHRRRFPIPVSKWERN